MQALRGQAQDGWLQRYLAGGRSRYYTYMYLCSASGRALSFLIASQPHRPPLHSGVDLRFCGLNPAP
jgi:hypothetical protein